MHALEAERKQAQQAAEAAQQVWHEQRAALEKQHLQALLRSKQVQEQERQQWQKERDALVQQLTAQYTALEMQVRAACKNNGCSMCRSLIDARYATALFELHFTPDHTPNPDHNAHQVGQH
jgi:hypothetical protein